MKPKQYNIAIIGAARRNQGTGPYIARQLHQLGHNICGFVGSGPHTIMSTRDHLRSWAGIDCNGYTSIDSLCRQQSVDIIAICSPIDSHHRYIEQSLDHECHVLIEKPWLWLNTDRQLQPAAENLVQRAKRIKKLIYMIAQWPFTLAYFKKLHPEVSFQRNQIRHFRMQLSPNSNNAQMMLDSVSHLLSMLYALVGFGDIEDPLVSNLQHTPHAQMCVQFAYKHAEGATQVDFDLSQAGNGVKPASYAINEQSVSREVLLPEYAMKLCTGDHKNTALPDPMTLCLQDFIGELASGINTDGELLLQHALHTRQLVNVVTQYLEDHGKNSF